MFAGFKPQTWAVLAAVVLLAALVAFFSGAWLAWDARGRVEAADRKTELAAAAQASVALQAHVNSEGLALAQRTLTSESATHAAEARGRQEIENAASTLDAVVLYAAWADARERVWNDAGLALAPAGDPGAARVAPGVRGDLDA